MKKQFYLVKRILVLYLLFLLPICLFSNEFALYYTVRDSVQIGFFGAPYASYSSETSFSLGLSLLLFEKNQKATIIAGQDFNLRADVRYSFEDEREYFIEGRIPFRRFQQVLNTKLEYKISPRSFYGIGGDTSDENKISYRREQYRFLADWTKIFKNAMSVGVSFDLSGYENTNIVQNSEFGVQSSELLGFDHFYRAIGIGPMFLYNTKTPKNYPLSGMMYKNEILFYQKTYGSDFNFMTMEQDFHYFHRLNFQKDHIIAAQIVSLNTFGETPFHYLSELGSGNMMRGLPTGRYIDEHLLATQVEYRSPLIFRRISAVCFVSTGLVYNSINDFVSDNLHFTGGAGLRFALDKQERVNVRADIGISSEGNQIYLKFGEVF